MKNLETNEMTVEVIEKKNVFDKVKDWGKAHPKLTKGLAIGTGVVGALGLLAVAVAKSKNDEETWETETVPSFENIGDYVVNDVTVGESGAVGDYLKAEDENIRDSDLISALAFVNRENENESEVSDETEVSETTEE